MLLHILQINAMMMIENKKNNADKINNTLTPMINNYLEKINKHSEPLSHA